MRPRSPRRRRRGAGQANTYLSLLFRGEAVAALEGDRRKWARKPIRAPPWGTAILLPLRTMPRATAPPSPAGPDVAALLRSWSRGDAGALDQLTPIVYEELRRLAHHYLRGE